ncbi:MAG: thioredoxin family protein [Bacteroidia bacterium]|nr:thioredoxin family protein [Bacteroidia bacterium]MDW8015670.1 thioredoxin family protein [Bacteroidia bacterium]
MRFIAASIALLIGSGLGAQTLYQRDISAAFAQAKKQKKPLWIMFSATWCGPCKLVETKVLPDARFQQAVLREFIPLKVYAASGEESTPGGDSLAEIYAVQGFPTFLCVEPSGEAFYRQVGLPSAEEGLVENFISSLESAKKARKELPEFRRRFQKGERSLEFLRSYLRQLVELEQKAEGEKVLEAYLKAAGSVRVAWLGEPGFVIYLSSIGLWSERQKEYALSIADTLRAELPPDLYEEVYEGILLADFTKRTKGLNRWTKLIETGEQFIRAHRQRFPFVERLVMEMLWKSGLKSSNPEVRQQAASLALQAIALDWPLEMPDAEERASLAQVYNSLAWNFYEQIEDPEKLWVAVILAKQALTFEPTAWYIWDTLGALYYKLKRKGEALAALDKAIELARKEGVNEAEYAGTIELQQKAHQLPE